MLKLEKISKVYGKTRGNEGYTALKEVSIEIKKGEFVAIMGPSGSGKSTLMNILGALDKPTTGRYELNGEEVSKLNEKSLAKFRNEEVGFVFQRFNLLPRTNVYDNVALPMLYARKEYRLKVANSIKERVEYVLSLVGLEEKKQNDSNSLSGGQIQRVAIARALVNNPSIIMADEPTGNLDSKTADKVMKLFQELNQKQGNTIILVTHSEETASYADRIIKIRDGEIEEDRIIKTVNKKTKEKK